MKITIEFLVDQKVALDNIGYDIKYFEKGAQAEFDAEKAESFIRGGIAKEVVQKAEEVKEESKKSKKKIVKKNDKK